MTPGALARVAMVREGAVAGADEVLVTYPSGETRRLAPGPSSVVSKAVVEVFALRFLHTPAVIVLRRESEQGRDPRRRLGDRGRIADPCGQEPA